MTRVPLVLLDRLGFSSHYYADAGGRSIFAPDEFEVRLVTSLKRLPMAVGEALSSVIGLSEFDDDSVLEAARFLAGLRGVKPKAVVALNENVLLSAAVVREQLGIEGDRHEDVWPFIDKVAMKERLAARGIRVPRFAPYSAVAARELLAEHGRIVAKPRASAGARDVAFIEDAKDLSDFEVEQRDRLGEFEVEEHIDGQIYHVDSVVRDAQVVAASVARYLDPTTCFRTYRTFRDIDLPDGELSESLTRFNREVIACFPGFSGVAHHEIFQTDHGPVFCEIAGRWGGGGVRAAFRRRTGIDIVQAMLYAQTGLEMPEPAVRGDGICGWASVYAPPGKVMQRTAELSEPWIVEQYFRFKPGDLPPAPVSVEQAVAVITVSGRDEPEVLERLERVDQQVLSCFDERRRA
jgi:biotin carboxylase